MKGMSRSMGLALAAAALAASAGASAQVVDQAQRGSLRSLGLSPFTPDRDIGSAINKRPRGANMAFRRAAAKKRNQQRHRKACKGR